MTKREIMEEMDKRLKELDEKIDRVIEVQVKLTEELGYTIEENRCRHCYYQTFILKKKDET